MAGPMVTLALIYLLLVTSGLIGLLQHHLG
jgi:hypothetical protein